MIDKNAVLDKIINPIKQKALFGIDKSRLPKHIAITTYGCKEWSIKNKKPIKEAYEIKLNKVYDILELQIAYKIPLITLHLSSPQLRKSDDYIAIMEEFAKFLEGLAKNKELHEHRIKVSVFGKWYDLPGGTVEATKKVIEETKDYDNYFLNLCINYDGQEEIVDACKIIARKVALNKIDPDSINKDVIKENIYSSYFLSPEMLIVTGTENKISGFMLWDSVHARIHFSNKLWPDFTKADFLKAMEEFKR